MAKTTHGSFEVLIVQGDPRSSPFIKRDGGDSDAPTNSRIGYCNSNLSVSAVYSIKKNSFPVQQIVLSAPEFMHSKHAGDSA